MKHQNKALILKETNRRKIMDEVKKSSLDCSETKKPCIFIGSSSEKIDVAMAIGGKLQDIADIRIWTDGVFEISQNNLESLEEEIDRSNYAVFVFAPEDKLRSRNKAYLSPRDNILFELGLFMGRLGRSNTSIVRDSNDKLKMPSNLAGLVVGKFDEAVLNQNIDSAVNDACHKIREKIKKLSLETKIPVASWQYIYPDRHNFTEKELFEFISKSMDIKILNIVFSIFRDIPRAKESFKDRLEKGACIEILLVQRKRKRIDHPSYLRIRESDEDRMVLRTSLNQTLFELFLFMLNDLYKPGLEHEKQLINRFIVKEYPFYPTMCMYLFDEEKMLFGPYIATKCERMPLFELSRKDINHQDAFKKILEHYNTLKNPKSRRNKYFVYDFSFWDGKEDVSIPKLISAKCKELREYLTQTKCQEYICYLKGAHPNPDLEDDILTDLGEVNELEGRFDMVMRDIFKNISDNRAMPSK